MGRPGITYQDVERAALQLKEKGVNPTVDAVRTLLGTGSKSTIAPNLQRWKASQGDSFASRGLPSDPDLMAFLKKMFGQLQTVSQSVENSAPELIAAYRALESERQRLKADISILEKRLARSDKDRMFLKQERVTLKEELRALQQELRENCH